MNKRELLMLARDYVPSKHHINGWYWSEKLDGVRCFWDGGVSIDKPIRDIPWANTSNKNRLVPRGTGLWSRYGNVICAPSWFIRNLPKDQPLDGELWLARGCLEDTRSIVSRHVPDARWHAITFNVFDMPSLLEFCKSGMINNPNFQKGIDEKECFEYFSVEKRSMGCQTFQQTRAHMHYLEENESLNVIEQTMLPFHEYESFIYPKLDEIVDAGGEGIVVRDPRSYWTPHRVKHLLRIKPKQDSECVVIGYNAGIGNRFGSLGSLIVRWKDKVFNLSGFNSQEGSVGDDSKLYELHSGERITGVNHPTFPIDTVITFRFNGLTNGGIPREARYWRKRPNEE